MPVLAPRSRLHASFQIILCVALFYLWPALLHPSWYVLLLPLAVFLAAGVVVVGGRVLASTSAVVHSGVGHWMVRMRRRIVDVLQRATRPWEIAKLRYRHTPNQQTRLIRSLLQHVAHAACFAWPCVSHCLRWLATQLLLVCMSTLQHHKHLFHPVRFRHPLSHVAEVFVATVRSSWRRVVWLCLCVLHFLTFTLGLTVIFPCLCAYGLVVSFIHLILCHGASNLARSTVSYLGR